MNKPIRVAWWGESALGATGFATVARNVLSRLVRDYHDDYEVVQLGLNHPPYAGYDHNIIPFDIMPSYGDAATAFWRFCDAVSPDIMITNHDVWITKPLIEHPAYKDRKFPIAHYHPIDGVTSDGGVPQQWRSAIALEDYTITYADWARSAFLKTCPDNPDRMLSISHGVDTKLYTSVDVQRKDDNVLIGMVAMNQYRKDHPTLIKAIAQAAVEVPSITLYMHCPANTSIGYDLIQFFQEYGITDRVIDLVIDGKKVSEGGLAMAKDMPRIYNMLDVHALITTGEGFGLPHAEAMACGVPSIATDYTTLRDLMPFDWQRVSVLDYRPIHIVPLQRAITDVDDLTQKIINLAKMPKERRMALGTDCAEFIRKYDWDNITPIWHNAIQHMVGKGRKK